MAVIVVFLIIVLSFVLTWCSLCCSYCRWCLVQTADTDKIRLSCVLSASVVWTELATSRDCWRNKIYKLNMFSFFRSFVQSRNAVWTGLVYKCIHTADRTGQNCSVSSILRTTGICQRLSPTLFTPPTRLDSLVLSMPATWTRHKLLLVVHCSMVNWTSCVSHMHLRHQFLYPPYNQQW